ncbi:unnamed protein product [Heligmosomoides polygyrus]|uniref:Uncharacterized protein n=1 Tax=Heligmosomoides polygyrus TaxID=6339 RepID=A0A183GFS1_HELPZ|nr:unnamed protein product [Heligmosomoides polygyrus]
MRLSPVRRQQVHGLRRRGELGHLAPGDVLSRYANGSRQRSTPDVRDDDRQNTHRKHASRALSMGPFRQETVRRPWQAAVHLQHPTDEHRFVHCWRFELHRRVFESGLCCLLTGCVPFGIKRCHVLAFRKWI